DRGLCGALFHLHDRPLPAPDRRAARRRRRPARQVPQRKGGVMTNGSPTRADRLSTVTSEPLRRDSLVGSWFHSESARSWQGGVVAEPAPGVYLVELHDWLMGSPSHQQLVPLDDMTDWLFYDDNEWLKNNYEHGGLKEQWEREQEAAGKG